MNFSFRQNAQVIGGAVCGIYLIRAAWCPRAFSSPLSHVLVAAAASYIAVLVFTIKAGDMEIDVKGFTIKGPACEVLFWCLGVLTMGFTFSLVQPDPSDSKDANEQSRIKSMEPNKTMEPTPSPAPKPPAAR